MAKILVVEDDRFIQDFICESLEGCGCRTIVAFDGEEALAQLKENPDTKLVLLHIMLHGKSGWEVFMEIRRTYSDLKVVFISAIEVSEERRDSLINKEGLADYIVKPFTKERLLEVVKRCLDKNLRTGDM